MVDIKKYLSDSKALLSLAWPVMAGQVGHMMFGVVDTLMVGRLGAENLAAASAANSVYVVIMILGIGLTVVIAPITSARVGAKDQKSLNLILVNSLIVIIPIAIILTAITIGLAFAFPIFKQAEGVNELADSYLILIGLSTLPLLIFQVYRHFIEGLGHTRPPMIMTWIGVIANVILNYVFIYGMGPIQAMGLDGCGIATILSRILMAILMIIFLRTSATYRQYRIQWKTIKLDVSVGLKIFKVGLPISLQMVFEVGAFSGAAIIIGWIGTNELAAHQIAINMASLTFMAVTGIAGAASIRVGYYFGEQNTQMVRFAGLQAIVIGSLFMTAFGFLFVLLHPWLPALYIEDRVVIEIASTLLLFAALFQISDGVQVVALGSLRGLEDTRVPTLITFIAYWLIALPGGYFLAFFTSLGVNGYWIGLTGGLTFSAVTLLWRFVHLTKPSP